MEETVPDILITDINMPFLNGVELLEKVREKFPDVVAFVVSGYDDFEYVKGTFMSGATNYLKKPVTKVELVNAVVRALEIISERENEKRRLRKMASQIQDREFSQMLQKEKQSFVPAVSINGKECFAGMSLMLIKVHNLPERIRQNYHDMTCFCYDFKQEIRRLTGYEEGIVFNYIYRSNEFIAVTEKTEKELEGIAKKLKCYFAEDSSFADTCLTICISGHSYSMENIHTAYVEAVGLLMARRYCRQDEILTPRQQMGSVNQRFGKECSKQLRSLLMVGNMEGVRQLIFETIGLAHCEKDGWSYLEVKQTMRQILNSLTDVALQEQGGGSIGDMENIMETLDKKAEDMDICKLCDMMKEAIDILKPENQVGDAESTREIVQKAAGWIDIHYAEELTLSSIAERYHVESSYFSKIFRQETGVNLILYITKKRIEKSKEYIRRVFKKNEGISPREYRNACRKEGEEM